MSKYFKSKSAFWNNKNIKKISIILQWWFFVCNYKPDKNQRKQVVEKCSCFKNNSNALKRRAFVYFELHFYSLLSHSLHIVGLCSSLFFDTWPQSHFFFRKTLSSSWWCKQWEKVRSTWYIIFKQKEEIWLEIRIMVL